MENIILTGDILGMIPEKDCSENPHINGDIPNPESVFIKGGCCSIVDGTSELDEYLKKSRLLSEFITEVEKAKARKNLGIVDDFTLRWGNIKGRIEELGDLWQNLLYLLKTIQDLEGKINTDLKETLKHIESELGTKITKELEAESASQQIMYNNVEFPNIKNIKDALDLMLYRDLTISISCSPSVVEDGESIPSIKYNWSFNKTNIVSQSFGELGLDVNLRTHTFEGPFTLNTTKTLKVNDGTKTFSASATLHFYPGLYYGVSSKDELTTLDIIKLTRRLASNRYSTVTVNAGFQDYIYICIPYSYGAASFKVGGFEGGFTLLNDNFIFNKYKDIRYRIYKSDNKGLGNTTITIS